MLAAAFWNMSFCLGLHLTMKGIKIFKPDTFFCRLGQHHLLLSHPFVSGVWHLAARRSQASIDRMIPKCVSMLMKNISERPHKWTTSLVKLLLIILFYRMISFVIIFVHGCPYFFTTYFLWMKMIVDILTTSTDAKRYSCCNSCYWERWKCRLAGS